MPYHADKPTTAVRPSSVRVEGPRPATIAIATIGAVAAGVALGFGTQILQGSLPGSWAVLANSGVMWAFAAFALGLTMPSSGSAGFGGAVALVAASVSYYVAVDWFEGVTSGPRGAVIWSLAGIVAGSTFGLAGYLARRSAQHRFSSWALVVGVLIGEGIRLIWYVGNDELRPAGIAELAIATVIAAICLRRTESAKTVAAITAAAALATWLASHIINGVFTAT